MKLQHSKEWYAEHITAEGNAEIGAGIPPWIHSRTKRLWKVPARSRDRQRHGNGERQSVSVSQTVDVEVDVLSLA